MLLSYKPKKSKIVYLLSFSHKSTIINDDEQKKPSAILDYKAIKERVDTTDKMLRTFSTKAHPKDELLRLFSIYHLLSWILWHRIHTLYVRIYRYQSVQNVIFSSNLV